MNKDKKAQGKVVIDFPKRSVKEEAADWLARLDSDSLTAEDKAAFKQWLNSSQAHLDAFEHLVSVWNDLNVLTELGRVRRPGTWFKPALGLAAVASLLIFILSSVWVLQQPPVTYKTLVGEQKTVLLDDSTEAVLNTNSEIRVAYDSKVRRVYLDKGEVSFDVASNKAVPFEVVTSRGIVRAVGTAFSVRIRDTENEVIVTEGIVEVDFKKLNPLLTNLPDKPALEKQSTPPVRIAAGRQVTFDEFKITAIENVDAAEVDQKLAWQKGMLYYNGEDLEKVVADVSRYTNIEIVIPEPAARQLRVGGYFRIGDVASLLEALKEGFGIQVEYVSSNLVYLKYPEEQ